MFRVLVAVVAVCLAVSMSGCTGSLRLGSVIAPHQIGMAN